MEEFIKLISQQLHIDDGTAKMATAETMNFVKGQVEPSLFEQIIKKVPGLEIILNMLKSGQSGSQSSGTANDKKEEAGGGLLGSIAGAIFGKNAAQGIELFNALKKLGLSTEDITKFVTALFEFLKKNVSPELVKKVLEQIPALSKLIK